MNGLEVGKIYKNGAKTREITSIDGYEISYKTETGKEKSCWATTFQDWISKGKSLEQKVKYSYEVIYVENGKEYTTTGDFKNVNTAKSVASKYKGNVKFSNVRLIEYKTTEKIIEF